MKSKFLAILAMAAALVSCGGGGKSTTVDVKQTQKPTMLVLPSDQLMQRFGCIRTEVSLGKQLQVRDYNSYLLADPDAKFIIASIQSAFIEFGYPLNDLEQTLKSINDQEMVDEVSGIKKDSKTILLTNARPDIILELDYDMTTDRSSRDYSKSLTYTLRAIDAFSKKVVATIQAAGVKNAKGNTATMMGEAIQKNSKDFTKQINKHFDDLIANGRDITMRVMIDANESFTMSDESIYGDTYADFILDYMKVNTMMGTYNLQRNTDTEMYFANVRIKTLNDNGTQYSAYDFARELSKALNKECGVKSKNVTQGLGDAMIIIKGM
ncbi:MAG: hypothetical protein IJ882_05630 [Paludibacteraceae bacterium]|nr:hypothetical protein [Paludibacteraceae bacterium]